MSEDINPVDVNPVTVLNSTSNVPPVEFVNVKVLLLYVDPVTSTSVYPTKNPETLNVPPVLLVKVPTPVNELYVPPVIVLSEAKTPKLSVNVTPSFLPIVKL